MLEILEMLDTDIEELKILDVELQKDKNDYE